MEENKSIESSQKSRLATLLFCLFLGVIGVHRFYVGKSGSGIAMLLISVTGFGLLITGIWCLIDFISIASGSFKDGKGLRVLNWETK